MNGRIKVSITPVDSTASAQTGQVPPLRSPRSPCLHRRQTRSDTKHTSPTLTHLPCRGSVDGTREQGELPTGRSSTWLIDDFNQGACSSAANAPRCGLRGVGKTCFWKVGVSVGCAGQSCSAQLSINRRVREIVEWSGGASGNTNRQTPAAQTESAPRHAITRSASRPSK